tara:strand:+ start:851 stop:1006 length:156 start_codon:yes stop_codon:yes gene_type:complete
MKFPDLPEELRKALLEKRAEKGANIPPHKTPLIHFYITLLKNRLSKHERTQ